MGRKLAIYLSSLVFKVQLAFTYMGYMKAPQQKQTDQRESKKPKWREISYSEERHNQGNFQPVSLQLPRIRRI